MSFQGDVRGIGLAELLQGLARGRKEGVLTLTSRGDRRSVLGMEDGKAWLLPDPEEDTERWRTRARSAWADDSTFSISAERLQPIVKAARLETLYALLDGGGVHFRFDPGEMPARFTRLEEEGHPVTEIHCDPTPIEFLLLEYARIADELELAGHPTLVPSDIIPCIADTDELGSLPPTLVQQIDGTSTILEIADRMGWPVRQAQLAVLTGASGGGLRIAHPIEVLRLALHELQRKQFARAASRLELWCRTGSPGPLVPEDAEALANEWLAGRLTAALRLMSPKNMRCLLRRLDASLGSTSHAVVHWTEANRIAPTDRIARLRLTAMQLRDGGEGCGLDAREVLDLARELRDHGSPMRSGPALAIAAFLQPTAIPQRLELGMGLVQANRVDEASPWVLSACTDLLAQGHADRILAPLRQLIELDPRNREARELLTRAKRQSTRSKTLRRNLAIGASVVALIGAGAVVKVKIDEKRADNLDEIRTLLDNPEIGIARLDSQFADDTSLEVGDLRREMEDRLRSDEMKKRSAWLDEYHQAQKEAQEGDAVVALEMIRELPPRPNLKLVTESWPSTEDLLLAMPTRMHDELLRLGYPKVDAPQQVAAEASVRARAESLRDALDEKERADPGLEEFRKALDEVVEVVIQRGNERSIAVHELERQEIQEENDRLLSLAHASVDRNEFERALRYYKEILANDVSGKVRRVLKDEIDGIRAKHRAVQNARKAAERGDHKRALKILNETFDEQVGVMLPFRVETTPPGVQVTIVHRSEGGEDDPVTRTTPFTIEGTFQDSWAMRFDLQEFDSHSMQVQGPQNIALDLSRTPEARFETDGRVDAVPAPIGDGTTGDYIVCDRNGTIQRIAWDGSVRWRQDIATVSGIARRPVPLPGRDDQMLLLTETGSVWLLDPKDGRVEGPWELEDPPVFGPVLEGGEVLAQLKSGRIARWRTSLRPTYEDATDASSLGESLRYGFQGLFTVLRPSGDPSPELRMPTAGDASRWTVRVEETRYVVFEEGSEDSSFTIAREGRWRYVAWEAPSTADELPILWISDQHGLRAFLPPGVDRDVSDRGTRDLEGPAAPTSLVRSVLAESRGGAEDGEEPAPMPGPPAPAPAEEPAPAPPATDPPASGGDGQ